METARAIGIKDARMLYRDVATIRRILSSS
jgi:hypothetical protein